MRGSRRTSRPAGPLLASALVVLIGAGACGGSGDRTVEVTIRHSAFDPPQIHAEPGENIRFVIRNLDPIDHEFILGNDAVQQRHEDGTEPHHGTIPGEVSVPAGGVRATTYELGERGTLPFGCHLPGHWAYGMRGEVLVG
jgi:uncharacterized cupredoxin-like copper-binding protein